MPALVGVISDTHGLIREEALRPLADVDLSIHAALPDHRAPKDVPVSP